MTTTRVAEGVYRVERGGRAEIVYVAGAPGNVWAFWNGRVFRQGDSTASPRSRARAAAGPHALTSPMPATVIKVLVHPGAAVKKGDTVVLLEAMKMELPVRALDDGVVTNVRCREGELVQGDAVLVELR